MDFVVKNIFLVMLAAVSGGMLLWPLLRKGAGGPWVSTLEATQLINRSDALVVDLRSAEEYAKGHILGAKSVPLADLERRAGEFEKNKAKAVIVHCGDGSRAGGGVAVLRRLGFSSVSNLSGGYAAWQQAGLPVEK
ncbi:MAG TPA: rhodanese-like domain-containing protein [Burkholderiales bacterium]|jgi:rhodanese-related sulfurtransferase|nr:rhodanese-like domain-containing protein [Burkholderiales bacterium]